MTGHVTQTLAEEIVSAQFAGIPPLAVARIKQALLDDIGAAFLSYAVFNRPFVRFIKTIGGQPESTVIGDGVRVPCAQGAGINAEMANTSNFVECGPGVHAWSSIAQTALAVGEREGASGKEVVTAAALAYELNARFAGNLRDERPVVHLFPAHLRRHLILNVVFCAAKLLKCDAPAVNAAIGLGWMFTPPTMKFTYLTARQGFIRSEHNLWTCQLGVQSALIAREGLGGPLDMIDHDGGEIFKLDALTRSPSPYHGVLHELCLKPWINSYGVMGGIEAAVTIVREERLQPDDIGSVVFRGATTYLDPGSLFVKPVPASSVEACASIPWSLANALLGYEAGPEWLEPANFRDPVRVALAGKVRLEASGDPRVNEAEITTRTGKSFTRRIERRNYLGSPANPLTPEQIEAKFLRNAQPVVGARRAREIMAVVAELEELPSIVALTRLLRPES